MAAVDARPAPAPAAADRVPVSRPAGLWLLTIALLVGPIVHLVALWLDRQWLNFGSRRAWDGLVYLLIAPLVKVRCQLQVVGTGLNTEGNPTFDYSGECKFRGQ